MENNLKNNFYIKALLRSAKICDVYPQGRQILKKIEEHLFCTNQIYLPYVWINNYSIYNIKIDTIKRREWEFAFFTIIKERFIKDIQNYIFKANNSVIPVNTIEKHLNQYSLSELLKRYCGICNIDVLKIINL
jgi:hypothetical protein